jgi:hypothetical protein
MSLELQQPANVLEAFMAMEPKDKGRLTLDLQCNAGVAEGIAQQIKQACLLQIDPMINESGERTIVIFNFDMSLNERVHVRLLDDETRAAVIRTAVDEGFGQYIGTGPDSSAAQLKRAEELGRQLSSTDIRYFTRGRKLILEKVNSILNTSRVPADVDLSVIHHKG